MFYFKCLSLNGIFVLYLNNKFNYKANKFQLKIKNRNNIMQTRI